MTGLDLVFAFPHFFLNHHATRSIKHLFTATPSTVSSSATTIHRPSRLSPLITRVGLVPASSIEPRSASFVGPELQGENHGYRRASTAGTASTASTTRSTTVTETAAVALCDFSFSRRNCRGVSSSQDQQDRPRQHEGSVLGTRDRVQCRA